MVTRRQKVFVASKPARDVYAPLPQYEWTTLQTKFGLRLPKDTKDEINAVCKKLVESRRASENLSAWTDVQKRLEHWRDTTRRLRRNIWKRGPMHKGAVEFESFRELVESLFNHDLSNQEKLYPLALLDRFMAGSIAASEHIEEYVQQWASNENYETELWFIWAALVLRHLGQAGNPIRHPSREQLDSDAPVKLIETLQARFPKELRKRKGASLRKAVVAAYKISIRGSLEQLNKMFEHWCNGGDLLMDRYCDTLKGKQLRLVQAFEKQLRLSTKFGRQRSPGMSESADKLLDEAKPRRITLP